MDTDRKTVVEALRLLGEHDRAFQASCALPPRVDTEKDAGLLAQLGLNPSMFTTAAELRAISTPADPR